MPVVAHKEALQLIANAGGVFSTGPGGEHLSEIQLYTSYGSLFRYQTYYSRAGSVLDKSSKKPYAMTTQNYTSVNTYAVFSAKEERRAIYINAGYVSEAVAGSEGSFAVNPTIEISLEASFKCFGLTLEFGSNNPLKMVFHAYHDGIQVEDYIVTDLTATTVISHEFEEFDRMILEFTKGYPNNG